MKRVSTLGVLFLLIVCACSDNDDPQSRKDLLIAHAWKFKGIEYDDGTFENAEACGADNVLTFKANGTYTQDEGAIKCGASSPQVYENTWSLSADEKELTMKINYGVSVDDTVFAIISLTSKELKIAESGVEYQVYTAVN